MLYMVPIVCAALLAAEGAEAARHRSQSARLAFVKSTPCPATREPRLPCPGYIIDHIDPLCAGGHDKPANMQWQTVEEAKIKDRDERRQCRK